MTTIPEFGLNGATTGEGADLDTDIRVASAAGYRWLELRDTKIERHLSGGGTLGALQKRLRDAGLRPLSVNALEDATPAAARDLEARVARLRTLCEWAQALEAPFVVAVPSLMPPEGWPETRIRVRAAASLRAFAAAAAPYGVMVGFEFLGFPRCSVNTLRAARNIVDDVDDPRVGLVIDAFHFYAGGSQIEDLDGLDPASLFAVHLDDAETGEPSSLSDAHRLLPGEGVIPLRSLIDRLRALGYPGPYSLELFRPEYWAWNPDELAQRGIESMRRLFA